VIYKCQISRFLVQRGFCKGMALLKAQCFKIVTGCKSCEDYRVYAHQMWTGPNTNDVLSAAANTSALGHVRSDYMAQMHGSSDAYKANTSHLIPPLGTVLTTLSSMMIGTYICFLHVCLYFKILRII
jgi:hypothetical protein